MKKIRKQPFEKGKHIQAHEASTVSIEQQPPIFSLHYIIKDYCISNCEKRHKVAFADTLRKLSQCTWGQLKQSGRHQLGYEIIKRNSIRVPLPRHITEDVHIIAFRFCDKAPIIGYREEAVFHIIGLDCNFRFYDHG